MRPILENRPASCVVHGEYTAFRIDLGKPRWTTCPDCASDLIAKQSDQEHLKRRAYAKGAAARTLAGKACLPPRLATACFTRYEIQEGEAQKTVRDALRDFAANFPGIKGGNLVMIGKTGTGKSHLAAAVIRHVVTKHLANARYTTAEDLFFRVRASYNDSREESEASIVREMVKPDLLVIDEVGIGRGTPHETGILAAVLSRRYDAMRSTILVSNVDLETLNDLLGERVADRLSETAEILIFDWPSYRRA